MFVDKIGVMAPGGNALRVDSDYMGEIVGIDPFTAYSAMFVLEFSFVVPIFLLVLFLVVFLIVIGFLMIPEERVRRVQATT